MDLIINVLNMQIVTRELPRVLHMARKDLHLANPA
jgi:hypothetical protein